MSEEENLIQEPQKKQKWLDNKKNKTIFITLMVILGILALLGLALGLYFGLRNSNKNTSPTNSSQNSSGTSESSSSGSQLSGSITSGSIITSSSATSGSISSSTSSSITSSASSSTTSSSTNPFIITRIAGEYNNNTSGGDGGAAIDATFFVPFTLGFVPSTNKAYIYELFRLREIDFNGTPVINTILGDGGPGCAFPGIGAVGNVAELDNRLLVADGDNNRILSYGTTPLIELWSGASVLSGCTSITTTDGPRLSATWQNPETIAVDSLGNVYVGNLATLTVRKWTSNINDVSNFAGGGPNSPTNLFQPAAQVNFSVTNFFKSFQIIGENLYFIGLSNLGVANLYHIRNINSTPEVRIAINTTSPGPLLNAFRFNPSDNFWYLGYTDFTIYRTTDLGLTPILIAGSPGIEGTSGDNGPAIDARMGSPEDMRMDSNNGLLILFTAQAVLRRIQL